MKTDRTDLESTFSPPKTPNCSFHRKHPLLPQTELGPLAGPTDRAPRSPRRGEARRRRRSEEPRREEPRGEREEPEEKPREAEEPRGGGEEERGGGERSEEVMQALYTSACNTSVGRRCHEVHGEGGEERGRW